MPETVSHFGDVLRQAIEEAKKVNAIATINNGMNFLMTLVYSELNADRCSGVPYGRC